MKKLLLILAIATAMVACQPSYADTKIQLQQTFGTGTSTTTPLGGVDDAAKVYQAYATAGERNEDSTTGTDYVSTSPECGMSAEINLATDASTTVYNGPAILCGYTLSVTVGTEAATIDDNTTAKITLPISWPVNYYGPMGKIFETSLVVNPGTNSTGTLQLDYRPLDADNTWVP